MREITSTANPFVKKLRALSSSKKARQENGTFIIEGWRGIHTLLSRESQAYKLEELVVSSEWRDDPRLPDSIDTVILPRYVFEKISDVKNSQGILGVVRHIPFPFEFFPDVGKYLLLDSIRDAGNLGTLIRSAVGAGFDGVLLYGDCIEPFNPKVVRSAMGTFAFSNIQTVSRTDVDRLMEGGYELCATTGIGGDSLYENKFTDKTVLIVGSEAHGICGELMQLASRRITIPLARECESLNAAIAGSICMFYIAQASRKKIVS